MKTIPDLGGKDTSSQIILIILEFRSFRIPLIGNPLTPLPPTLCWRKLSLLGNQRLLVRMCDSAFDISAPLPRSAFDIWFPPPVNFHYRTHLADSLLWQNSAFRFVSIPNLAFPHCADLRRNLEFVKHSFKGLQQIQIVLHFPANNPKEAFFFILQQSTSFAQDKNFNKLTIVWTLYYVYIVVEVTVNMAK